MSARVLFAVVATLCVVSSAWTLNLRDYSQESTSVEAVGAFTTQVLPTSQKKCSPEKPFTINFTRPAGTEGKDLWVCFRWNSDLNTRSCQPNAGAVDEGWAPRDEGEHEYQLGVCPTGEQCALNTDAEWATASITVEAGASEQHDGEKGTQSHPATANKPATANESAEESTAVEAVGAFTTQVIEVTPSKPGPGGGTPIIQADENVTIKFRRPLGDQELNVCSKWRNMANCTKETGDEITREAPSNAGLFNLTVQVEVLGAPSQYSKPFDVVVVKLATANKTATANESAEESTAVEATAVVKPATANETANKPATANESAEESTAVEATANGPCAKGECRKVDSVLEKIKQVIEKRGLDGILKMDN